MQTTKRQANRVVAGIVLAAGMVFTSAVAFARQKVEPATQAFAAANQPAVVPETMGQTGSGQTVPISPQPEGPQILHLLVGRSLVITSPIPIRRILLADPSIADAIVVSPTEVVVSGKAPGGVSLVIWDEDGHSQSFDISVDIDVLSLIQTIHETFPSEPVQIHTSGNAVVLSGDVSSAAVADKIFQVVKNSTPKVTNLMEVPLSSPVQVSLQVRFAEVNKVAMQQLGVNILRNFGSNMPLSVTTQQFSPPGLTQTSSVSTNGNTSVTQASGNEFLLSNLLNVAIFRPDINLAVLIQALQEKNLLQILAAPNLLTESGKQASFLAGGQFPYPVLQSVTAGTAGAITIRFKEFGIRLTFTPTVRADGLIHLKVAPEVSSLDFANGLQIAGFKIPSLDTNNVSSEMDLKDGQSFAIAGLLDNRVTEQFEKIPFISDVPVLGKLFQSQDFERSKNELLVVVTPHIVRPIAKGQPVPGLQFPKAFLPTNDSHGKKKQGK